MKNCFLIPTLLTLFLFLPISSSAGEIDLGLEKIAEGFEFPVLVTHAGDGSGRLFVVERRGKIWILDQEGNRLPKPFIDLGPDGEDRVASTEDTGDERGLLGLAFHPDYEENGRFFLHYSLKDPTQEGEESKYPASTMVAEYTVSDDPDVADTAEKLIFGPVEQPYWNHNGGSIEFNPHDGCTGCLYLGLGDGGSANDPHGNGQNLETFLGKILRIDVDSGDPYSIPGDNPKLTPRGPNEIWAFGMRNPWRFSFDRETGALFAGDVGQGTREEVDIIEKGGNYGWNTMEGFSCFNPAKDCDTKDLILPISQYDHPAGCSITGGYVYRGGRFPSLYGRYFFADYCLGKIWSIGQNVEGKWDREPTLHDETGYLISSFGEDESGEIYIVKFMMREGTVYRLIDKKAGH
ncbi:MAG: PQQ-dependent sugar dehydrogenase [Candidatus Omnitrophica bacterium]|nr:PQQ-dependent sugar dehydrogenase [Candidatus Omnitrophota bacterium]